MDILEYIENNYDGWEIAENGKYLYNLGIEGQETIILDVENNKLIELPCDINNYLIFHSNNEGNDYIISASDNIINIINKKKFKTINAHDYDITSLLKTDKYLISSSSDETVKLWSLNNFEHIHTFNHNDDVLCINHYNNYLVSGDFEGIVKMWNMDTFELINEININEYLVSVAICDKYIAFTTSESKLYIINYEFNILYTFSHQSRYIYFLQFSFDGNYLYSGTGDDVIMYSTDTFKIIKKHNHISFASSHCLCKDNYKILYVDERKFYYIYTPIFHKFIISLLDKQGDYFLPNELILLIIKYL